MIHGVRPAFRSLQMALSIGAVLAGGVFFSQTLSQANAAAVMNQLQPTKEQALVTRQLSVLMDRVHYLNQPLDAMMSLRILDGYLDSLDPDHSLFLQSDVDEFHAKYGSTLGTLMKQGKLEPAFEIFSRFRIRQQGYMDYVLAQLDNPPSLHQQDRLNTDREKAPFFATVKEQQQFWQQSLVSQLISMTLAKQEEQAKQAAVKANPTLAQGQELSAPQEGSPVDTLKKRYRRQAEQIQRLKNDRVLEQFLNAALAAYDPHSNYFAPVEAMEMNRQTTLQLEGIGVSIRPDKSNDDYTRIETIVEGGPASKSGQVRAGDRIIGVAQDGEAMVDVVGWPSSEIVGLIRGPRGTKVTLKLLATGASSNQSRLVTLTRDIIQEEDAGIRTRVISVPRSDKTWRIGVMDIPSFYLNYRARREGNSYRSVSEDTANAIATLQSQSIDGMVIDLRNNPGGSLEEVAKMLGMFIKSGPVVQIRDGNGAVNVYMDPDKGHQLYAGPMIVMVNLASASASEIFSAAIQDYQRGLIIGSTTTGKGTAQVQLDSLAYGQATLTQRKFYRITGGSTQNKGVIPDIPLISIYDEDLGERKAKNALKWDTISTSPYQRAGNFVPYLPQLLAASKQRVAQDPQFGFLAEMKTIADANKDRKVLSLDIDTRRKELLDTEAKTLAAENQRRLKTGQPAYANWESYQAALEAQSEARAKMKTAQRPELPEDEAFVNEAAEVLIDGVQLTAGQPVSVPKGKPVVLPAPPAQTSQMSSGSGMRE